MQENREIQDWKDSHPAAAAMVEGQLVRNSPYTFDRLLRLQVETRLALVRRVAEAKGGSEIRAIGLLYTGRTEGELEAECCQITRIHRHEMMRHGRRPSDG